MKVDRLLQIAAAVIALGTLGTWLATGAHRGWSQNKIPETVVDEITGIEVTQYRDGFVAGLDVLALGLGAGLILGVASAFTPSRKAKA